MHILEGLKIALDNIDAVIDLIRSSKDTETAKTGLMESFDLSALQAQAILNMRLSKLTGLERDKLDAEIKETAALIARLEAILASDTVLVSVIVAELEEVKQLYGDARRTEILDIDVRHRRRGHDRRGGDGGHRHPRRLRQAQPEGDLPAAAARRPRHHRRLHPRGGLRRPALRGLDPRHHADVHQQGPGLRAARSGRSRRPAAPPRARPSST